MDAPTGEQPMDVLGAANTLHRVSTERLLPHRPAVTCVFPSARAREPFYATFSFVSRCHAAGMCGSRPRATRIRVRIRACTCSTRLRLPPSSSCSSVRPSGGRRRRCARTSSVNSALLFYSRLFESSFAVLRALARVSPPSSSSSSSCFFFSFSLHRVRPRLIFVFLFFVFLTVSLAMQPAHFRLSLSVADDTPSLGLSHTSPHLSRAPPGCEET